jgi:hypothetical protein
MSRLIRVRHAARLVAAGIGPGACLGAAYNWRPTVIRLDSVAGPAAEQWRPVQTKISPKVARQISSGSMTGLCTDFVSCD